MHQTATDDGTSSSTKASQMRVANHTSATDSCRTSLSRLISKESYSHQQTTSFVTSWCERKSVRTCPNGNKYWTKLQAQTHSSAQHTHTQRSNAKIQGQQNANLTKLAKKLPATAEQRNTDDRRRSSRLHTNDLNIYETLTFLKELSREIVCKPSPYTNVKLEQTQNACQLRVSPEAESAPNNT